MVEQIQEFLDDKNGRAAWLKDRRFEMYVRKAVHLNEEGRLTLTLDIANIVCRRPGRGYFTKLLANLETIAHAPIYIESVINEELVPFLIKRGYKKVPNTNPKCFIRDASGKTNALGLEI